MQIEMALINISSTVVISIVAMNVNYYNVYSVTCTWTTNLQSTVIEKGRQFHACALILNGSERACVKLTTFFYDNRPAIQCTANCTDLAKL